MTSARPFEGPASDRQRNALQSWAALGAGCETVLVGDEAGCAEIARELNCIHEPQLDYTPFGRPLVPSVIEAGERHARHELMCNINADIILTDDFISAVRQLLALRAPWVMVGRRWNVEIEGSWDFSAADSTERLRELAHRTGRMQGPTAIDYFVYTRGLWGTIPPFGKGSGREDNWMIHRALSLNVDLIDATAAVCAVHQNHDPPRLAGSKYTASPDFPDRAANNQVLARNRISDVLGSVNDATHLLDETGLRRKPVSLQAALRRFLVWGPYRRPLLRWPCRALYAAYSWCNRIKSRLNQT
ncbi:MAG: hypothetical protein O2901_12810 [Verrucomicrobia bacterium]|nr:hypothetical protein [Verrucomicrobiota bacterium]